MTGYGKRMAALLAAWLALAALAGCARARPGGRCPGIRTRGTYRRAMRPERRSW